MTSRRIDEVGRESGGLAEPERSEDAAASPGSDREGPSGAGKLVSRHGYKLVAVASISTGIFIWYLVTRYMDIPRYVLPPPEAVWESLYEGLTRRPSDRSGFLYHLIDTLKGVVGGYSIGAGLGLVAAAAMAEFRPVERALMPYAVGLQSLPKVALAPLFVIWFGYGMESKIVMGAVIVFFPMLINSLAGLQSTDRERLELMSSMGASRWQTFRFVKMPSALPFIFTGLKLGVVYALLGIIVAEFVGSQRGMGVIITQMQTLSNTAGVFAALVILGLTGYSLHSLVSAVYRRVAFWVHEPTR